MNKKILTLIVAASVLAGVAATAYSLNRVNFTGVVSVVAGGGGIQPTQSALTDAILSMHFGKFMIAALKSEKRPVWSLSGMWDTRRIIHTYQIKHFTPIPEGFHYSLDVTYRPAWIAGESFDTEDTTYYFIRAEPNLLQALQMPLNRFLPLIENRILRENLRTQPDTILFMPSMHHLQMQGYQDVSEHNRCRPFEPGYVNLDFKYQSLDNFTLEIKNVSCVGAAPAKLPAQSMIIPMVSITSDPSAASAGEDAWLTRAIVEALARADQYSVAAVSDRFFIQFQLALSYPQWRKFENDISKVFTDSENVTAFELYRMSASDKIFQLQTSQFSETAQRQLARSLTSACERHQIECKVYVSRYRGAHAWRIR